jgi:hypothetical protein
MHVLAEGRYPLVIFPEGEIYHHHEQLDVLNEGMAAILLRGAGMVREGKGCYAVPTAIRYVHDPAVADTFSERLSRLEARVAWKPRPRLDPVDRIYRLGGGLLALKEQEFLGRAQAGPLPERIRDLQTALVDRVEAKHGRVKEDARMPERVKALRNKIRRKLTDPDAGPSDDEAWALYDDLDTLFTAVQLYSYPGQYLRDHPSVDRIAETLLKLEEDVLGQGTYPAPCEAYVRFAAPLDVKAFLAARSLDVRTGVGPMTLAIGKQIQDMLEGVQP